MNKSGSSKLPRDAGGRGGAPQQSPRNRHPKTPGQSKPRSPLDVLTPREQAVLAQIARGASSREVGVKRGVSRRTIEFHRANIMRKLGIRKIVDLMLLTLKEAGNP